MQEVEERFILQKDEARRVFSVCIFQQSKRVFFMLGVCGFHG
jgi:hypothetical protein